jgi:hypothetical protein
MHGAATAMYKRIRVPLDDEVAQHGPQARPCMPARVHARPCMAARVHAGPCMAARVRAVHLLNACPPAHAGIAPWPTSMH